MPQKHNKSVSHPAAAYIQTLQIFLLKKVENSHTGRNSNHIVAQLPRLPVRGFQLDFTMLFIVNVYESLFLNFLSQPAYKFLKRRGSVIGAWLTSLIECLSHGRCSEHVGPGPGAAPTHFSMTPDKKMLQVHLFCVVGWPFKI